MERDNQSRDLWSWTTQSPKCQGGSVARVLPSQERGQSFPSLHTPWLSITFWNLINLIGTLCCWFIILSIVLHHLVLPAPKFRAPSNIQRTFCSEKAISRFQSGNGYLQARWGTQTPPPRPSKTPKFKSPTKLRWYCSPRVPKLEG